MKNMEQRQKEVLRQRQQLAVWLHEWEMDRVLAGDESLPAREAGQVRDTLRLVDPYLYKARAPEPGAIVLVRPNAAAVCRGDGPLYMLVWSAAAAQQSVWIPFGRFATPGLSGEWRTGLSAGPLQVLCFWNRQYVPTGDEPAHWIVRQLSGRARQECSEAYRLYEEDASLAVARQHRFGPPLLHPADPRHDYMDEEKERVEAGLATAPGPLTLPVGAPRRFLSEGPGGDGGEWLIAAEPAATYAQPEQIYEVGEGVAQLLVYALSGGRARVRMIGATGTVCRDFDSGWIEGRRGRRLVQVADGGAILEWADEADLLSIIMPSGERVGLRLLPGPS
jgi:hypothetical protein